MFILIPLVAFFVSLLTFFSGFGLGTLLMPFMALFFPVAVAIALTALVHFLTNLFKAALFFRHIPFRLLLFFGIPALFAAFLGAWLLGKLSLLKPLMTYSFFNVEHSVTLVKIVVGVLLIIFATVEIFPLKKVTFSDKSPFLIIAGALSGFFGGLSGHQGAFRSAILVHANLSPSAFIGTNAVLAVLVDSARLAVYGWGFHFYQKTQFWLVLLAVGASLGAVLIGRFFIKRITLQFIQIIVAILLYLLGLSLIIGLI